MTDLKQVNSRPEFIQDMLMASVRNHAALAEATIWTQGQWMGVIFDENKIVYAVFPDMTQPAGTAMIEIAGGPEVPLAKAKTGEPGCFLTAFAVNDLEEAQMFAEIAALRQMDIERYGTMTEFTQMFWEKMTPGGRITNEYMTVEEWKVLVSEMAEAALILERYDRNDCNSNPSAE